MKLTSKYTITASYISYITQATTLNFSPLLFTTFEKTYGISLGQIGLLIAVAFLTQLAVDAFEAKFASRLNTRVTIVLGHICTAIGMISFAILPDIMPDPYIGLMIPTVLAAIGGGVIEVLISPIVEACPTDEKSSAMSLLHSFYSWGSAGIIIISTIFFAFIGIEHWRFLACFWAITPTIGAILFSVVPIYKLDADDSGKKKDKKQSLARSGMFWVFFIIMICSGSAEMVMSQWASNFVETGLGVSKTLGDLLGPCAFAIFMGLSRVFHAFMGKKVKLSVFFTISAALCTVAYLLTALSPFRSLSLLGCALCGLSVGIMWPGTYSLATERISFGGTRMFALLALAGDVGCVLGPSISGGIADLFGDDLKISFLVSAIFPLIIFALMPFVIMYSKKKKTSENKKSQEGN